MRLFLALDLPGELRAELAALQARLGGGLRGWRWLRPQGIHLTLRFLGEVPDVDEPGQRESWRRAVAAHGPVRLVPGELGVFPQRGVPRVLWMALVEPDRAGKLAALAASLEEAARRAGFAPESRSFRPHLSLARAARGGRPDAPPPGPVAVRTEFDATEVVLFRSHLSPQGARYEPLAAFPLTGS